MNQNMAAAKDSSKLVALRRLPMQSWLLKSRRTATR